MLCVFLLHAPNTPSSLPVGQPAAKIAIIVVGAVTAVVVVVLSAVYTKRAIDRRLAQLQVHEEVRVEEQHFLLGEAEGGTAGPHGVVVSVETPLLTVRQGYPRVG